MEKFTSTLAFLVMPKTAVFIPHINSGNYEDNHCLYTTVIMMTDSWFYTVTCYGHYKML